MSRPRVAAYQASVRRMPSSKETRGIQPSSLAGPVGGHDPRREIAGPGRPEADLDVADEVSHGLGDAPDGDRLVAVEVEGPVLGDRLEGQHVGPGEVADVHEEPLLEAVAVDPQRLAAEGPLEEGGGHAVVPHPRAVGDAVAQHGVGPAVERVVVAAHHLRRHLGGDVDVAVGVGLERRGLVHDRLGRRGVDPHRRGQDDPAGLGQAGGFEHAHRAHRVEGHALDRRGEDVVHVGHGGEVEDGVGAPDGLGEPVLVHHVDLGPVGLAALGRAGVEHPDAMAGVEQCVDDVRPDEARPSGDGDGLATRPDFFVTSAPVPTPTASMTMSTSSSVMTADTGRQTWRAHSSSAPGSGPSAHGSNTGWQVQRRVVHLARQTRRRTPRGATA